MKIIAAGNTYEQVRFVECVVDRLSQDVIMMYRIDVIDLVCYGNSDIGIESCIKFVSGSNKKGYELVVFAGSVPESQIKYAMSHGLEVILLGDLNYIASQKSYNVHKLVLSGDLDEYNSIALDEFEEYLLQVLDSISNKDVLTVNE